MNREEQIKRLAQNLFNKGFTKSMDFAVQTAARMLGFPEDFLKDDLEKNKREACKYGGESLLNGGVKYEGVSREAEVAPKRDYRALHEQIHDSSSDLKRIRQSIAEDNVYSQISSGMRQAVSNVPNTVNNVIINAENKMSPEIMTPNRERDYSIPNESTKYSSDLASGGLVVSSRPREELRLDMGREYNRNPLHAQPVGVQEQKQSLSLDLSGVHDSEHEYSQSEQEQSANWPDMGTQELKLEQGDFHAGEMSSEPSIFDGYNQQQKSQLEIKSQESDSFVASPSEDLVANNSFEPLAGAEQTSLISGFMDSNNSNNGSNSNPTQIESNIFESEISMASSEEDFFSVSQRMEQEKQPVTQSAQPQMLAVGGGMSSEIIVNERPSSSNSGNTNSMAESTVDITQMFNYSNLKNR